jgi:HAD superfamily hydrolase (TIGR01509 family)
MAQKVAMMAAFILASRAPRVRFMKCEERLNCNGSLTRYSSLTPSSLSQLLQRRDNFLFDLDGTLVDSNACHERAYLMTLRPRLPELAAKFNYEPCKGRRTRDALRDLGIEDEHLIEELNETKQQAYRELVDAGAVALIPYAREVLTALRQREKRLFIVTGGSRRSSESVLRSLGILDWFEALVTADDIVNSKPAPDCWLQCVAKAGLEPSQSLVVEDAFNGILSARAAGLDAIAVNNPELAHLPEYAGTLENVHRALDAARASS